MLRGLLAKDGAEVKGHAHYLLGLNECLRRSVVDRWAHGQTRWSKNDGLIAVSPSIAAALAVRRLTERSYSMSALQRFTDLNTSERPTVGAVDKDRALAYVNSGRPDPPHCAPYEG